MTNATLEKRTGPKFQVVDDSEVQRSLATQLIKKFYKTAEIHEAQNGAEALEQLAKGFVPDLVLSDVTMPIMNGVEFVTQMRQKYPALKALLVTGDANPDILVQSCGANGYLAKPYKHEDLKNKIDALLPK